MIGVIIAAMPEKELFVPPESFVIAADQGYRNATENKIVPELVLGDFDSLGYVPNVPDILCFPTEKDDSDLMLSLREGLHRGIRSFLIYGGLGGRLDHTFSNIQSLAFLESQGAHGLLYGNGSAVMLLRDCSVCFPAHLSGTISVFSYSDRSIGVTESGLQYSISDRTLRNDLPIGLSNTFIGKESTVSVKKGTLILIWQTNAKDAWRVFSDQN